MLPVTSFHAIISRAIHHHPSKYRVVDGSFSIDPILILTNAIEIDELRINVESREIEKGGEMPRDN